MGAPGGDRPHPFECKRGAGRNYSLLALQVPERVGRRPSRAAAHRICTAIDRQRLARSRRAAQRPTDRGIQTMSYNYATDRGLVVPSTGNLVITRNEEGKIFRCDDTANVTVTVSN